MSGWSQRDNVADVQIYDSASASWRAIGRAVSPTMDHRGLLVLDGALVRLGGMAAGQRVTAAVDADALPAD